MTYEEWLNIIEELKTANINLEKLNIIKNTEINNNINDLLITKIELLIRERFNNHINKIIKELSNIFQDINYLDLTLLNFQKELKFLTELSTIKQLPIQKQNELKEMLKTESTKVFDILNNEAKIVDHTGALTSVINNYRIKWSE